MALPVEEETQAPKQNPMESVPTGVVVTVATALLAGIVGLLLHGVLGWILVVVIAGGAAYVASTITGAATQDESGHAAHFLKLLEGGGSWEDSPPSGFSHAWKAVYERVNQLELEARTSMRSREELERFHKHADMAVSMIREGKDPLTEVAELRVGPLHGLLESMKEGVITGPLVSRLSLGEEELIGDDALGSPWPKGVPDPTAVERERVRVRSGVRNLVRAIDELVGSVGGGTPASAHGADPSTRTPAQLVDQVVLTAADGIEDLAAGLMRANELASVAERVTNRATLLALNASLEATRSGSEAFAAIAEETRRLAEFAREATDTISRLSSEIEFKVGETITAIHATSEDAKTSLAAYAGSSEPLHAPSVGRSDLESLRQRARQILGVLEDPHETKDTPPLPVSVPGNEDGQGQEVADEGRETASPTQAIVEKGPAAADTLSTEGILLIEGLKPDAHLES